MNSFFTLIILIAITCSSYAQSTKINGASLVAPPIKEELNFVELRKTNANWVAIIPYAFLKKGSTKIAYNTKFQWWGERAEGVVQTIIEAKKNGFQIMLKPHLWVSQDGWAGDFSLETEQEWQNWEISYANYILEFAKLAQKHSVELFCVGTEIRNVAKNRPQFWCQLILKLRENFNGKLTYAANWDNYKSIDFWDELDYIGIDSYFPLSEEKIPNKKYLIEQWQPIKKELEKYSETHHTPILFTEFGYPSTEYCATTPWKENFEFKPNQEGQKNAYEAIFESFWNEKWFAGGFFWKWHLTPKTQRAIPQNYSPQRKSAMEVIRNQYKKSAKFR